MFRLQMYTFATFMVEYANVFHMSRFLAVYAAEF